MKTIKPKLKPLPRDINSVSASVKREMQLLQSNPLRSWDNLIRLVEHGVDLRARAALGHALLRLAEGFLND